jgi:prepilin-type N-terminal cleavage/methylation domain-containing protein
MTRRISQRGFTLVELMVVVAIVLILVGVMFGVNGKPYGGNPRTVSDQIVSAMNTAKMRAVSSRRFHTVVVTPQAVTLYQWSVVGMTTPTGINYTCATQPCYQYVQNYPLATGITVWDKTTTACAANGCSGAPSAANASLSWNIDFRPDGSSTGGTLYVTDTIGNERYRVVVYTATGTSYARNSW